MHIQITRVDESGRPVAYRMELSPDDTYTWCKMHNADSGFVGDSVVVCGERDTFSDLQIATISEQQCYYNAVAMMAMIDDFLPPFYRHLWPVGSNHAASNTCN